MKLGRPLGHSWFGYDLILCVLCTSLTWSSSCWIIPMKQNFMHSLKNIVRQFKFCYFYFIAIIIGTIILFKSKKDKLYFLHYWIYWYSWSFLKADKSSHKALVIQSNQRLMWIYQISQHTAKKITKWIIIASNIGHNNKSLTVSGHIFNPWLTVFFFSQFVNMP